ncbi:MAG: MCP four helix bundle domain-containing protein, partial [Rubrivivax sp.]
MNASPRLTVRRKLYAASTALVLAMVVLATSVWVMLTSKAESLVAIEDTRVPQLTRIAAIELNVTRASLQVRHAMLARTPEEQAAALADIAERKKVLEATLKAFGDAQDSAEGKAAFEPLPALMQRFWTVGGENIALIQQGQKDAAAGFLVDQTIPARNALLGPLAQEKDRQTQELQTEVHEVLADVSFARNLAVGIVLAVSVGVFMQALWLVRVMRQLGGEPEELKQAANAVAQGDLASEIPVRPGDTTSVMAAMATMRARLAHTVRLVRQNADSVATASTQIAQGNADLSHRTEQQASALQHTASSMEQLGSTVQQNEQNARQANQWATGAAQVAQQGGSMVGE